MLLWMVSKAFWWHEALLRACQGSLLRDRGPGRHKAGAEAASRQAGAEPGALGNHAKSWQRRQPVFSLFRGLPWLFLGPFDQVGVTCLVAAADEMQLSKTSKGSERLASWLQAGRVADVGEGWQRLLEKEEAPEGGPTLKEVWEAEKRVRCNTRWIEMD